jgi:hypothetical protein
MPGYATLLDRFIVSNAHSHHSYHRRWTQGLTPFKAHNCLMMLQPYTGQATQHTALVHPLAQWACCANQRHMLLMQQHCKPSPPTGCDCHYAIRTGATGTTNLFRLHRTTTPHTVCTSLQAARQCTFHDMASQYLAVHTTTWIATSSLSCSMHAQDQYWL